MTYNLNNNILLSSSASLDCINLSVLCSAINSTVATVRENFTSQH